MRNVWFEIIFTQKALYFKKTEIPVKSNSDTF